MLAGAQGGVDPLDCGEAEGRGTYSHPDVHLHDEGLRRAWLLEDHGLAKEIPQALPLESTLGPCTGCGAER